MFEPTTHEENIESLVINNVGSPGICALDKDFKVIYTNSPFDKMILHLFGISETQGEQFNSFLKEAVNERKLIKSLEKALQGIEQNRRVILHKKEGTEYQVLFKPLLKNNFVAGVVLTFFEHNPFNFHESPEIPEKEDEIKDSIGSWELNLKTGEVFFSGFWKKFLKNENITSLASRHRFISFIHPTDLLNFQKVYDESVEKKVDNFQIKFRAKINNEEYVPILNSTFIEYDSSGRPTRMISYCRDCLAEEQLEQKWQEEEAMLREVERIADLGHYQYNFSQDNCTFSIQLHHLFGLPDGQELTMSKWSELIHPEDKEEVLQYFDNVIENQSYFDKVYRIVNFSNQKVYNVHGKGRLIYDDAGDPLYMFGTIQNVTELISIQRENQHMAKFAEHTQSGLLVTNAKGVTTWVHPSMAMITGHDPEELLGEKPGMLQGPDTDPKHIAAFQKGLATKKPFRQEILNYKKDGTPIWNEVQVTPLLNDFGEVQEFLGIQIDITDRKRMEQELAESEAKLRSITDSLPGWVLRYHWTKTKDSKFVYVSEGIKDCYGVSPEEALADIRNVTNKIHKDDLKYLTETMMESAKTMTKWKCEWRVFKKKNETRWLRGIGNPVKLEDDSIIWDCLVIDVTEIKEAQQAERIAKNQLESLVNSTAGVIWKARPNNQLFYVSDQAHKIIGYGKRQCYEPKFWESKIHPEDRENVQSIRKANLNKSRSHQIEYRFQHKNGKYLWIRDLARFQSLENEKPFFQGIMLDITKEKSAQLEFKEVSENYKYLAENTSDIICIQDSNLKYNYISESVRKVLGYTQKELTNRNEKSITLKEDHFVLNQIKNFTSNGSDEMTMEYRLIKKNRDIAWFRVTKKIVEPEGGKKRILSSYTNITEKKKAELELIFNERRFRILAENSSDAIVVFNPDYTINYVSPGASKVFGHSSKESAGWNPLDYIYPEDQDVIYELFSLIGAGETDFTQEYRMFTKSKDIIWVETKTHVMLENGKISRVISTTNDITKRKVAELKQKEALDQLQLVVSTAKIGIWKYFNKKVEANQQLLNILSIDSQEFQQTFKEITRLIVKEDHKRFDLAIREMENGESVNDLSISVQREDGKRIHISFSGSPVTDHYGAVVGLIGAFQDITEIVQRKELLRKKIHQLEMAAKTAKMGMFTLDATADKTEYNEEFFKIYDVNPAEVNEKQLFWEEMVLPEDRIEALDTYNLLKSGASNERESRYRIRTKDGQVKHIYSVGSTISKRRDKREIVGVNMDISDLVENERMLKEALKEKDTLLKELHHRVKNNLQMVSNILYIKSKRFQNIEMRELVRDINSKIISVAQVHESLLHQKTDDSIPIKSYIDDLMKNLINSFSSEKKKIKSVLKISEYRLESDLVLSIGLIIHEVVTNILKYAYEEYEENVIKLSFTKKSGAFKLNLQDLGKGLSADQISESTGITLIRTLVETIEGSLDIVSQDGLKYIISFPAKKQPRS